MRRPLLIALLALVAGAATLMPAYADQGDRKARRAAIVAGAVREDVAKEVARHRYSECKKESGYDSACEQRLYEDKAKAHRAARRTAIIVGSERR